MTSRSRQTATGRQETIETTAAGGGDGSLTFLGSDDAGSQTLSSQPAQEPATNSRPTVIRPSDVSDMSLTEAAYWIATEGGSRDGDVNNAEIWKLAFDQLLKKIVDGKIAVLGRKFDDGLHEQVSSSHFLKLKISYPYCSDPADLATGDEPHLQCWGVVDEEHRLNGFRCTTKANRRCTSKANRRVSCGNCSCV